MWQNTQILEQDSTNMIILGLVPQACEDRPRKHAVMRDKFGGPGIADFDPRGRKARPTGAESERPDMEPLGRQVC